jgi:hypothetical protein
MGEEVSNYGEAVNSCLRMKGGVWGEVWRGWERLGEAGRGWERLGEAGRGWRMLAGVR